MQVLLVFFLSLYVSPGANLLLYLVYYWNKNAAELDTKKFAAISPKATFHSQQQRSLIYCIVTHTSTRCSPFSYFSFLHLRLHPFNTVDSA